MLDFQGATTRPDATTRATKISTGTFPPGRTWAGPTTSTCRGGSQKLRLGQFLRLSVADIRATAKEVVVFGGTYHKPQLFVKKNDRFLFMILFYLEAFKTFKIKKNPKRLSK